MDRIELRVDPDSTFPRHYTGEVRVHLDDGSSLVHREASIAVTPSGRCRTQEVRAKFIDNATLHFTPSTRAGDMRRGARARPAAVGDRARSLLAHDPDATRRRAAIPVRPRIAPASPAIEHRIRSSLPLAGLRVLAVEQYGAGPFGTSYLADLGAEVIKIENHKDGGDVGRHVGPHFFGAEDSHFFQTFNRNKKSITLDLKHPEGHGGVPSRWWRGPTRCSTTCAATCRPSSASTYAALKEVNPRIVCTHLSAYGREGSRTAWPGYDYLMQAEAGHMTLTGEPDGPPTRYGLSIVDLMTGLAAAFAPAGRRDQRARRPASALDIDTSLFDVALHNLNYPGTWYLNAGTVTGRTARSGHPSLVPSQLYRTQDGWLFIMCNKEKFWPLLANELGHPEWINDPGLCNFAARLAHRDQVTRLLDDALMKRRRRHGSNGWRARCRSSPVFDVAQALENPFVHERGGVVDYAYADGRAAA